MVGSGRPTTIPTLPTLRSYELNRIERALISVYDKSGVVDFARGLADLGVEILSTGGTASLLAANGIVVRDVQDVTGFPEMLDGRVKTLHPRIHGGLLARRDDPAHMRQIAEHEIRPIDMVCTNLYPFQETTEREEVTFQEIIENIDIGGPSMIRAAAKNFLDVAVVTSPDDYGMVLDQLREGDGILPQNQLFALAQKAFVHTGQYDGLIAQFLSQVKPGDRGFELPAEREFPPRLFMNFEKMADLRYGENPHQKAAMYAWGDLPRHGLAAARQLQGKELSYNNLVDLDSAWALIHEFSEPACCVVKHTNPCGMAVGDDVYHAYLKAYEADPVSAFGSIVAVNRVLDPATAEEMSKLFVEAIIAPEIDPKAKEVFSRKKNLRVLEARMSDQSTGSAGLEVKRVSGGILLQESDASNELTGSSIRVVTAREPSRAEWADLRFAWKIAKHVKSNAIVVALDGKTAGVGAGQMSRVDAVRLAVDKARPTAAGCALASDAFFPFRDGIDEAGKAGVRAVIQPGGSKRDQEVIDAANEHGLAMVFTGIRHFKH